MKQPVERRLAAILAADVAGYSRLMGADEEGTLERLKAHRRELADAKIKEHRGRIVKTTGDGLLVEFPSVVDAVRCAVEMQRAMVDRNADTPEDRRIAFRIGINLGDVIIDGGDIYGDGVNIAARLEALAEPGGICISRVVRDQIRDKLPYLFADLGEQSVKNIARPVRAYAMSAATVASTPQVAAPVRLGRARSLRRLIIPATAVAVLCIALVAWWTWPKGTPPAAPVQSPAPASEQVVATVSNTAAPRLSIVVLPFSNLSNDPDQEYFVDGVTDDLTTDLSRISGSFVIARNTAFTYKGKPADAKQIGRELGVRYVLEGSVRRTGDQVRVNVQLIDAETGAHLWADRFDTTRANLPEAQNEITGRLARSLNVELVRDASRRIEQEKAVDPGARDLMMRGWASFYQPRSQANIKEVQRAFEQALALDPRSVDARIGLAMALTSIFTNGWSSSVQQDQARAEQLLLEALERDPDLSKAHNAMAVVRRTQNRLAEGRIESEKAIALDPNDADAQNNLGRQLMMMGQPEAAIPHIEKALHLSPHDPNIWVYYWGLGVCHLVLGRVDEAIDFFRKARAANPRLWFHHLWLAAALGLKGDLDEAKAALAESLKLNPQVDSVAHWRAQFPWLTNPPFWALLEKTWYVGLRRAGFPDE
jgi:TolB-like protein/class 3 adenylate cyclase/tetratricopeptide (TPR) repeat protein